MFHDHLPRTAGRLAVVLYGIRSRGRQYERNLKKYAEIQALSLLSRADACCEIWSHPFHFEGDEFLLSTLMQSPREIVRRVNGHRNETMLLPARLVIEVAPAPIGLSRRTLLRPRDLRTPDTERNARRIANPVPGRIAAPREAPRPRKP